WTQALKSKFADILNGIEITEYVSSDLPKENIRIETPQVEQISDEQIGKINELMTETDTQPEQFLKFMKIDSFDLFNSDDAKRAISALNQKKEALCLKK